MALSVFSHGYRHHSKYVSSSSQVKRLYHLGEQAVISDSTRTLVEITMASLHKM